jgi:hypothetical protein
MFVQYKHKPHATWHACRQHCGSAPLRNACTQWWCNAWGWGFLVECHFASFNHAACQAECTACSVPVTFSTGNCWNSCTLGCSLGCSAPTSGVMQRGTLGFHVGSLCRQYCHLRHTLAVLGACPLAAVCDSITDCLSWAGWERGAPPAKHWGSVCTPLTGCARPR